jgi:hypothetical protein
MTTPESVILSAILTIVSLFILYWIIRVAVCHGIEDARRRAARKAREATGWDPAQPS